MAKRRIENNAHHRKKRKAIEYEISHRSALSFDPPLDPSEMEILVADELRKLGHRTILQELWRGPSRKTYTLDIWLPDLKIAIEVNGCTMHNHGCRYDQMANKYKRRARRDRKLRKDVEDAGQFRLVEIWTCELREDPEGAVADALSRAST